MKYLETFEDYELTKARTLGAEKSVIPKASKVQNDLLKLQEERQVLLNKLSNVTH